MAKNVWYKIPFQSQLGINYELRIYKEGTPSSVTTLKPGAVPFKTDENNSEDFFAPVRTQTGNIGVIYEPSTQFPTVDSFMEAIMPASNIDSPVKLVKIATTETVVWQGFLNSESFSQSYISFAQDVTIPVISVLDAMDSIQISTDAVEGLMTVKDVIGRVINQTIYSTGIHALILNFYIPTIANGGGIMSKKIDTISLFEQKEYTNENSTTYIVSGLSCLEILRRICQYMGWTCREVAKELYFEDANETTQMTCYQRVYNVGDTELTAQWSNLLTTPATVVASTMAAELNYRGDGHQMSIAQGAKSVEVVANIDTNRFELKIPPFPFGDVTPEDTRIMAETDSGSVVQVYVYNVLNKNTSAYNNLAYAYYESICRRIDNTDTFSYVGPSTKDTVLQKMILRGYPARNYDYDGDGADHRYAGAFLIRYAIEEEETSIHTFSEGLYCSLNPGIGEVAGMSPIFKMWTMRPYSFYDGRIAINFDLFYIGVQRYNGQNAAIITTKLDDPYLDIDSEDMFFYLKVGDLYWNGTQFTSSFSKFSISMSKGAFRHEIPVDDFIFGTVEFGIYSRVTVSDFNTLLEVLFKRIDIDFIPNEYATLSDRGENKYFQLLGTNFSDEVSVNVDFASWLNNAPSPSLIMEDETTAMKELNYGTAQSPSMRRPEVVLLDRLATYYSLPRRTVKLEAEHPTSALMPLLRLTGYDSKVYLPLAESRDWQADKSTLMCMETPE